MDTKSGNVENMLISKVALELAKKLSHEVWAKYDDAFGYRTEKQKRNAEAPTETADDMWFFWNQFDSRNQWEFMVLVATYNQDLPEVKELLDWIRERKKEEAKFLEEQKA